MKKKIILLVMACFFVAIVGSGHAEAKDGVKLSTKQRRAAKKKLAPRYKEWLNMIHHISLSDERDVFLSLTNDKDREIFIRSFWQQRDPTPGTLENEYKKEIQTRFSHVQTVLKRGSSRPGWMTDMGMFYMILGKPNSMERFDSKAGLYPAQVWYYFGDKTLGLPTYFSVMFYKPHNTTEWKFYNPSVEGPASLLVQTDPIDDANFEGIYDKIKELAPELAMPAFTMIPNEMDSSFRPPMRNNLVVKNIHEAPKRKINVSYATHFLNYKGYVDLETSINYIQNNKTVSVTRYDRFGFSFVNITLRPKQISVGYSEEKEQYYFSYDLNVTLKKGAEFIYEDKKHFDFYMDSAKVDTLKGNGLVLHHSFPVIPGQYTLTAFAMNSVGKEFTYFDKTIDVPATDDQPVLSTPVLGYRVEEQQDNFFFPYRVNDKKLFVDAKRNFRLREKPHMWVGAYNIDRDLWNKGKLAITLKGLNERQPYTKNYNIPLKLYNYHQNMNILLRLGDDPGLNPDYYETQVKLLDGENKELYRREVNFSVSPVSNFGYPMESFNKMRVENPFYFFSVLAGQFERSGDLAQAETYFSKSLKSNPQFIEGLVSYLRILNKLKKYTQVIVESEKLKGNQKFAFDYYLLRATALFGMRDYNETLKNLLEANKIYNSDIRVLNLLGFTFLNLKEYEQALKAFDASLKLNDKQPAIINTVNRVKKEKGLK